MKIYEIEAGEKVEIEQNFENFYSLVEQNCSEALSAMKATKKFLYRGVKYAQHSAFHGKSRENRNTLDTSERSQRSIDFLLKHSGFTALRSNSIFCTSSSSFAGGYGLTYLIFPINGFAFTWAKRIRDLAFSEIQGDDPSLVSKYGFNGTNFVAALMSGNEIYIHGEYYACSVETYGAFMKDKVFKNNT
jgi:hypothetical protein